MKKMTSAILASALFVSACGEPELVNPPQTAQECASYAEARAARVLSGGVNSGAGIGGALFLAVAGVAIAANTRTRVEINCLENIGLTSQDAVSVQQYSNASLSGVSSGSATAARDLNLTADERRIWATLDDEQKARAILFIQNGGTLIASLGSH
ncbi:MAG TPA: hypothetical protein EYG79_09755 [Rhodobacteraceae bacterium]|nr:hypothetical protein [Paracoccaceae bacterium]